MQHNFPSFSPLLLCFLLFWIIHVEFLFMLYSSTHRSDLTVIQAFSGRGSPSHDTARAHAHTCMHTHTVIRRSLDVFYYRTRVRGHYEMWLCVFVVIPDLIIKLMLLLWNRGSDYPAGHLAHNDPLLSQMLSWQHPQQQTVSVLTLSSPQVLLLFQLFLFYSSFLIDKKYVKRPESSSTNCWFILVSLTNSPQQCPAQVFTTQHFTNVVFTVNIII